MIRTINSTMARAGWAGLLRDADKGHETIIRKDGVERAVLVPWDLYVRRFYGQEGKAKSVLEDGEEVRQAIAGWNKEAAKLVDELDRESEE